jgi:UPF0716 protein FxsA
MPLITDAARVGAASRGGYPAERPDYIDGEVVDVRDVKAPTLPAEMRGGFPGHPGWD